jgi:PIN domain nuclease of toxin-antitoxin system
MRLLLDTHACLWAITEDPRLGPRSRALITTEASAVLLSHASLWEIAIKHALVRGDMPLSAAQAIDWAEEAGFDRLLVAQSLRESLTLLSADRASEVYGAPLRDARPEAAAPTPSSPSHCRASTSRIRAS